MDEEEWDDEIWSRLDALESRHWQRTAAADGNGGGSSSGNSGSGSGGGVSVSVSSSDGAGRWACRSCTLVNAPELPACQLCRTPRGQLYQQQPLQSSRPPQGAGPAPPTMLVGGGAASVSSTSMAMANPRRTVQATLPFGRAGDDPSHSTSNDNDDGNKNRRSHVSTARTSAASPSPTPPPPLHQQQQHQQQQPSHRATGEDPIAGTRYLEPPPPAGSSLRPPPPRLDDEAVRTFVYPTNYPIRDYQLAIAEKALYHNTLVSLPTGLGKTLIAAVVMFNFYRWFPDGQIVFMAPTKPLVAQQIRACHEIMGLPLGDTAELQGSVPPATRRVLWRSKRVFYCTPQSLQNDLHRGYCPAERFVCVVIDEAHRATGNYAYCGVVHEVARRTTQFRVLALSATPGAKFEVIQEVIRNLRITHIESRTADDGDVKRYTHARQEEVIRCSLGAHIAEVKTLFLRVFQRILHRLFTGNILQHKDPERLTKYYVLQMRERFRQSPAYQSNRGAESDLALLVTLLHARDLLTGHGLASFKESIDKMVGESRAAGGRVSWSKKELLASTEFQSLQLRLEQVSVDSSVLGSSTTSSSHPKLIKIKEVLHEHFQRHAAGNSNTRAIVFTQYRSSVAEIVAVLEGLAPLLKVQQFVGQGASGKGKESKGQSQKLQQEIVRKFRAGVFNVLVATCIAEEGLDIGEVDLIVSFDALTSPVRMIQRMGRTGRKRVGKVIILVTEGDEEKKLARSVSAAKTVSRALTTFKNKFVFGKCPRMIPPGIIPQLSTSEMQIPEFHASQVAGKQQPGLRVGNSRNNPEERQDTWKLNDLELAIARTKYFPPILQERQYFKPVLSYRKCLLRSQRFIQAYKYRDNDSSFGPSSQSNVLTTIVQNLHPLIEDEPTGVVSEVHRACDVEMEVTKPSHRDTYGENAFEVSDSDEEHLHFSPQFQQFHEQSEAQDSNTSAVSGISTTTITSSERLQREELPAIPVLNDEARSRGGSSTPSSKKLSVSRETTGRTPPTKTPPSVRGKKRGRTPDKRKQIDTIDEKLLARGERILERLSQLAMVASDTSTDLSSPEPEPTTRHEIDETIHDEERASPTKTHDVSECTFPRLTRRLFFDTYEPRTRALAGSDTENCVPHPPPIGQAVAIEQETRAEHITIPARGNASEACQDLRQVTLAKKQPGFNIDISSIRKETNEGDVVEVESVASRLTPQVSTLSLKNVRPSASELDCATSIAVKETGPSTMTQAATSPAVPLSSASRSSSSEEACSVCGDQESFDDDPIVFCGGCNAAVHQFCYGIPELPNDDWFCDPCASSKKLKPRCALCPLRGGAMKLSQCGQWAHIQCFMWIPELQFHYVDNVLRLGSIERLDPDRRTLECSLCHSKTSKGIIQCAYKRCLVAFHVSCAAFSDCQLIQQDQSGNTLFLAYCRRHRVTDGLAPSIPGSSEQPRSSKVSTTPHKTDVNAIPGVIYKSPSALIATQSDTPSELNKKKFRRLKRKYEATPTQPSNAAETSQHSCSPWAKRVRRSEKRGKRKREQGRELAMMFIDDEVEVNSSDGSDDDECNDADHELESSFINDSSQLIYSQSLPTPERTRKEKRRSIGEMRAIYAQSLIQSPDTPAFFRRSRGRRLLSGGVIDACLQQLRSDSHSPPPSSPAESHDSVQHTLPALEEAIEIDDDAADHNTTNSTKHKRVQTVCVHQSAAQRDDDDDDDFEMIPNPSFALVGPKTPLINANEAVPPQTPPNNPGPPKHPDVHVNDLTVQERMEANRKRALEKLRRKKELLSRAQHQSTNHPLESNFVAEKPQPPPPQPVVEAAPPPEVLGVPSFSLLGAAQEHPAKEIGTGPMEMQASKRAGALVCARLATRLFEEAPTCDDIDFDMCDDIEADAVLSCRVGALYFTEEDLSQLTRSCSGVQGVLNCDRVRIPSVVFKKLVVLIRTTNTRSIATYTAAFANAAQVRVQICANDTDAQTQLCNIVRKEAQQGFALPRGSSGSFQLHGLDQHFQERFAFFRSVGGLKVGSALSLSFRFDKFIRSQIPVQKFNHMHWRRMLPWLSEAEARELHSKFITSTGN